LRREKRTRSPSYPLRSQATRGRHRSGLLGRAGIVLTGKGIVSVLIDDQAFKCSAIPLFEFGQRWLRRGERQFDIGRQGGCPSIDQPAIPIRMHAQIGNARLKVLLAN
jgi:hypothetical protein